MVSVLIVEDDDGLQVFYKQILEINGFEIFGIANNGEEAVEIFKRSNKKPDVILMDHRMPVKNGLEASREILSIDKKAKIIFTTADKTIYEDALELGACSFKDKPFTIEHLIKNIKKAISKK
ncbi:MAG: response regulator [Promethearchaeota archaeon]